MKKYDYELFDLTHYPETGRHIECATRTPYVIIKGEDSWGYRDRFGKDRMTKVSSWVVSSNEWLFEVQVREFRSLDKAVDYAYKSYIKSLKEKLKYAKEASNN